ncbi:MAG: beta-ketoacyl-[acyl-carrier-protein] synthase family protein [Candidatus Riflebacteria bacterium]|nr:beta-ketoacyl-[acyl-carrier-protein] synthase family protein [Candidatus Riflebacteria bacterium]
MTAKVAITGVGLVTPVGISAESSFSALLSGKNGIVNLPELVKAGFPVTSAGVISEFEELVRKEPQAANTTSRKAVFGATALREALSQAGSSAATSGRGGIFLGVETGRININKLFSMFVDSGTQKCIDPKRFGEKSFRFLDKNEALSKHPYFVPNFLSELFGIKGEIRSVSNACSSSNQAIGEGFRKVALGQLDWAIVGGTDDMVDLYMLSGFYLLGALSTGYPPEKSSRPFDARRKGFVLGEGSGMLFIESLERALARKAKPIALIGGYSSGASGLKITETNPEGVLMAMKEAISQAGAGSDEIDYINAHGTGTAMNDAAETEAIKKYFGSRASAIPVNSTKSMIGHTIAAAGAIEAVVTAMSIQRGEIHPTVNIEFPDPELDLDYVSTGSRKLVIRNAISNSLGFAGVNSSLVFSKYN